MRTLIKDWLRVAHGRPDRKLELNTDGENLLLCRWGLCPCHTTWGRGRERVCTKLLGIISHVTVPVPTDKETGSERRGSLRKVTDLITESKSMPLFDDVTW